jgi:hypothetical protein
VDLHPRDAPARQTRPERFRVDGELGQLGHRRSPSALAAGREGQEACSLLRVAAIGAKS